MRRWILLGLVGLVHATDETKKQVTSAPYGDTLRFKCEEMSNKAVYTGDACYYALDNKYKSKADADVACATLLPDSSASIQTTVDAPATVKTALNFKAGEYGSSDADFASGKLALCKASTLFSCDIGTEFNGNCYTKTSNVGSWANGLKKCCDAGLTMATITDEDSAQFLTSFAGKSGNGAWIQVIDNAVAPSVSQGSGYGKTGSFPYIITKSDASSCSSSAVWTYGTDKDNRDVICQKQAAHPFAATNETSYLPDCKALELCPKGCCKGDAEPTTQQPLQHIDWIEAPRLVRVALRQGLYNGDKIIMEATPKSFNFDTVDFRLATKTDFAFATTANMKTKCNTVSYSQNWATQELTPNCTAFPFTYGKRFRLEMTKNESGIEMTYDGKKMISFTQPKVDPSGAILLSTSNDLSVHSIQYVPSPTQGAFKLPRLARVALRQGIYNGDTLIITATPAKFGFDTLTISLNSQSDQAFRFDIRMTGKCYAIAHTEGWNDVNVVTQCSKFPFAYGRQFNLTLYKQDNNINVTLDGTFLQTYNTGKTDPSSMSILHVGGDASVTAMQYIPSPTQGKPEAPRLARVAVSGLTNGQVFNFTATPVKNPAAGEFIQVFFDTTQEYIISMTIRMMTKCIEFTSGNNAPDSKCVDKSTFTFGKKFEGIIKVTGVNRYEISIDGKVVNTFTGKNSPASAAKIIGIVGDVRIHSMDLN